MSNKVMKKIIKASIEASNDVAQTSTLDTMIARSIVACKELGDNLKLLDKLQIKLQGDLHMLAHSDNAKIYCASVVWKYAYLCAAMRVLLTWIDSNGIFANDCIDSNAAGVDTVKILNVLKFWLEDCDD